MKPEEKVFSIAIKLAKEQGSVPYSSGDRITLEASEIKIEGGCLIIVDPENYIPREVHCYPLSSVRQFIFDYEAIEKGKVEIG